MRGMRHVRLDLVGERKSISVRRASLEFYLTGLVAL